jgi:hypothetical protein
MLDTAGLIAGSLIGLGALILHWLGPDLRSNKVSRVRTLKGMQV